MKKFLLRKWCLHVAALLTISTWNAHSQENEGGIFSLGISDDANVQFVWRANSEPDVAGYKLYVGTTPGLYSGFIDVGNVTTFKVGDLLRGMTYYFTLTAYNTSGLESDPTPELSAEIAVLTPLPDPEATTPAHTNEPPYFEPVADLVLAEGTTNHSILLLGVRSGAEGELDTVTVSASSSAPQLIPNPDITYANPDGTALLTLAPLPDAAGSATITIMADDGQQENNTFSRSFNVTIEPLNTPPTVGDILDLWIFKNRLTDAIPITVADAETVPESLEVTVSSSNGEVIPVSGLILTGSGANRFLTIDPSNGRAGVSVITVTASDGSTSSSMSFAVTVLNLVNL